MKHFILIAASLLAIGASAQTTAQEEGYVQQEELFQQLEPTYLDNVFSANVWDSNWFISAKGGLSAFVGKPVGHGDLFDRKKTLLNVSFGKWFTPHIGSRISYQGLKFVDSNIMSQKYMNIHADFLYNIAAHFRKDYNVLPKWDVVPYVGFGVIHNSYTKKKPFALSYGLMARYRLAHRLHLSGEIGATTTWQYFDGPSPSSKLGDHLLQASIGLDITIGKVGWKRVIDPTPYIFQNDIMMDKYAKLKEENAKLDKMHKKDAMALAEMRKILEIEGLLDKYNLVMSDSSQIRNNPRNNYSGLNSLRARLRNKGWNGDKNNYKPVLATDTEEEDTIKMSAEEYFQIMKDGKIFVGSPIFFFFHIGTDRLTEKAQIINIKEVASCIKRYGLYARIVGAADSQTGTAYGNEKLSSKRAQYMADMLKKLGVPEERMEIQYRGGINSYEPAHGNRNTCIMLYFK